MAMLYLPCSQTCADYCKEGLVAFCSQRAGKAMEEVRLTKMSEPLKTMLGFEVVQGMDDYRWQEQAGGGHIMEEG